MKKDWTGNKKSIYATLGASNHCEDERETNDFYATDPTAIDDLLKYEKFDKNILECAVGQGHLAKRLSEYGYNVECQDIIDRGYPNTKIVDFLKQEQKFYGDIITNPPYKYCSEFILKSLDTIENGNKIAMFLKLQTLEGQKRYNEIFKKYPPKTVYVFTKRKKCFKNGIDYGTSSAVCYSWFIWVKGEYNCTQIKWIN
jgi:hypothetical protein